MQTRQLLWFVTLITIACPLVAAEQATKTVFPQGELFEPVVADPKEAQFSAGLHRVDSSGRLGEFTAGIVSYGEYFGLVRWNKPNGRAWQMSIGGALFAQFNMDGKSKDLINADYSVGLSATHKYGPMSYRFRILHQSTHLGDELLLGESAPPERVNFSLEAVDFSSAYDWGLFRFYGGLGYLINVEPRELDRIELQFGGEFNESKQRSSTGHWIGGVDIKAYEGDDWDMNTAVKIGLEFGKYGSGNRRLRIMLEGYEGKSPFGQFYNVRVNSYGLSCYLLF